MKQSRIKYYEGCSCDTKLYLFRNYGVSIQCKIRKKGLQKMRQGGVVPPSILVQLPYCEEKYTTPTPAHCCVILTVLTVPGTLGYKKILPFNFGKYCKNPTN
jgi:hypothetical protein